MNSEVVFFRSHLLINKLFNKSTKIKIEEIKRIEIVMDKSRPKIVFLTLYISLIILVSILSAYFPTHLSILLVLLIYVLMFHFLNLNDHYLMIDSVNKKSIKVRVKKQDVEKAIELIDSVVYRDYIRHTNAFNYNMKIVN